MMSSAVNPANGNNSTMPGDYEAWPRPGALNTPFPASASTPRPIMPSTRPILPQNPATSSALGLQPRTPFPRLPLAPPPVRPGINQPFSQRPVYPLGVRHHRRRSFAPDIVLHRRSRYRSSCGRRRVFTIPLDNRPTLGLRGPPKCVLEIERVPCRRRRRRSSVCYEYECEDVPPQPTVMVANPIANPCLPSAQQPFIVSANNTAAAATSSLLLSNLTEETINNLPRQTVVLPPMHMPGSQADANTELNSILFPAEIINPADGTLSVIQANPGINGVGTTNIQPVITAPIQPQSISIPTNTGISIAPGRPLSSPAIIPTTAGIPFTSRGSPLSSATAADPLTQRFHELFQRLNMRQNQTKSIAQNPPVIRPTLPTISQFDPTNNTVNDLPIISSINTTNIGPYPSVNIRPTHTPNIGSYRPTSITPTTPANIGSYPTTNIRPIHTPNIGSYRPTSITPTNITSNGPSNIAPYRSSTFTPSTPINNATYRPTSITPTNITSNGPSNIAPYRSSTFTPSTPINNATYRPTNTTLSNISDINPYPAANIRPYTSIANRSNNNPLSQPFPSSEQTPYASAPPITSTSSFPAYPLSSSLPFSNGNNSLNPPSSPLPVISIPSQVTNSMPKSILRNAKPSNITPTTYTN